MKTLIGRLGLCIAAATFGGAADAQNVCKVGTPVKGPGVLPSDSFAKSISIDGTRAVVGAPFFDGATSNSGAAFVFDVNGTSWTPSALLRASNGKSSDGFGGAVGLDGDRAIVGAQFVDHGGTDGGLAYLFDRQGSGWVQSAILVPSDPSPNKFFGHAVDVSGDRAVVGGGFGGANAVYVFEKQLGIWTEVARLTEPTAGAGQYYGSAVAIEGDVLVAGAEQANAPFGAAFVYERVAGVWTKAGKLVASDPQENGRFGFDVAVDSGRILIGAPRTVFSSLGPVLGRAYLFEKTLGAWVETERFVSPAPLVGDEFGLTLDLDGDRALIGDPAWGAEHRTGAAFLFERHGADWDLLARFENPAGSAVGTFAVVVAVAGDHVAVGDPAGAGRATVWTVPGTSAEVGSGCPGDGAIVPALEIGGCLSAGEQTSLRITEAVGPSIALLLVGSTQIATPLPGGCDLVVGPPSGGLLVPLFGFGPGSASVTLGATLPPSSLQGEFLVQGFVADGAAPPGYSVTNGARLEF